MKSLTDKVVLITGSSRGIGRASARLFAKMGAQVIITGRTEAPGSNTLGSLAEAAEDIKNDGGKVLAISADLAERSAVEKLVARVKNQFGGCDILINNAVNMGRNAYAPLEDISMDGWDAVVAVNLSAPIMLAKSFLPVMKARGQGIIINVTSEAGDFSKGPGDVSGFAYGATKAALNLMTQRWGRDLLPHNIAAITLDPGFVASEMVVAHATNGVVASAREKISATAMQPMDIPARALVDLCMSDDILDHAGKIVVARDYLQSRNG